MIPPAIIEKINQSIQTNKPFVAFSLPESESVTIYFQKETGDFHPTDDLESGFVFFPFDGNEVAYCIPNDKAETSTFDLKLSQDKTKDVEIKGSKIEKEAHIELVAKAISEIKSTKTSKIVTSRVQKISIQKFSIDSLLQRIFLMPTSTFRYVWFHPKTSIWCGATPELLLKTEDVCFHTMALAATRAYENENTRIDWNAKEITEHQLVVDDITTKLQKVVSVLKMSKQQNHRAGAVVHLRTDIRGCFKKGKTNPFVIANLLHPTPAVCGTPQNAAFQFIKDFESYSREFYTGYLGCIYGTDEDSYLYVNLRCMKIENNEAHIYVGGGITESSNPKLEWEETQNKMKTMLEVLAPML